MNMSLETKEKLRSDEVLKTAKSFFLANTPVSENHLI